MALAGDDTGSGHGSVRLKVKIEVDRCRTSFHSGRSTPANIAKGMELMLQLRGESGRNLFTCVSDVFETRRGTRAVFNL